MDLARAKGKTLVNICSLFKQKIESCNVKRRRQRKRRLIRKKKQQLCTCSTLFFVHFFPVLLHDYNVKLPETSQLHVLWRTDIVCVAGNFFFAAAFFHLADASISLFFFLCKRPDGHTIYRRDALLIEMQHFTPAYMKGGSTKSSTDVRP